MKCKTILQFTMIFLGAGSNPVTAALGKAGFTKLSMVTSQANWH